MYTYFNGLVIREGKDLIDQKKLKELYLDAGWHQNKDDSWQDEKFIIASNNSTWVFTVWNKEELVGVIRVLSDQVMFGNIHDLVVRTEYRGRGIGRELVKLCLEKLRHGTWYAHTTPENYDFYRKCGFDINELELEGNCTYYGRRKAREQGHR